MVLGYTGPLIKNLLKLLQDQTKPQPLSFKKLNMEMLSKILLPVAVSLGQTELKTSEIKKLEIGDVVSLDNSIRSAITINLADKVVILGQPGIANGRAVARVVGVEKEKEVQVAPPIYVEEKKEEKKGEAPKEAAPKPAVGTPPPLKPSFAFPKRPIVPPPRPKLTIEEELPEEEEFPEEEFEEEEFPEEEFEEEEEFPEEEKEESK
jgi:hypothetical protein